jgi:hypothetical protein
VRPGAYESAAAAMRIMILVEAARKRRCRLKSLKCRAFLEVNMREHEKNIRYVRFKNTGGSRDTHGTHAGQAGAQRHNFYRYARIASRVVSRTVTCNGTWDSA